MADQNWRTHSIALASLLMLASGCSVQSTEQQVHAAQEALTRRDFPAAMINAKSALQQDPNSAEARLLLGEALVRSDDGRSALLELAKARGLNADPERLAMLEAEALLQTQSYPAAVTKLDEIKQLKPQGSAAFHVLMARAEALQNRMDAADAEIAKARGLDSAYTPAILFEARRMADTGRQDDAGKSIDQLLAREPNSEEAWLLKGELALKGKPTRFDAAVEAFGRALKIRANSIPAHAGMMNTAFARNDLPAAKAHLKVMAKALPQHPLNYLYGAEIAFTEGNVTTAREQIQPLIKNAGEDAKVLMLAGAIETLGKAYPLGENYLRKSLLLSPSNPTATRMLAQNLLASGQPAKALALIEPQLTTSSSDAELLALAGEASLAQRNIPKALKYFGRTAELDPSNTRAQTALALGQYHSGHPTEAISALSTLAKSASDDFADLALITLHMSRNDFDAATKAVEALDRKRPGAAIVPQMQGQINLGRGDLKAARTSFAKAVDRDKGYYAAVASLAYMELDGGNLEAAQKLLQSYLKSDVDNLPARAWLIELRARAGAPRTELDTLIADLVRRHPAEAAPRVLLVNHLLAFAQIKPALAAAQEAATAIPDNPDLQDALGRSQAAAQDSAQAIATFKRLISNHPRLPMPYVHLADVQVAIGDVNSAIYSLQRAVNLAPQMASAQRGLIQLLGSKGRYAEALAAARQMQAVAASRLSGYLLAGDIEMRRQRWDAAATNYRAGLGVEPASELAIGLRNALQASNRSAEAQSFAADWQAKYPKDNVFAFAQGEWAVRDERWPLAESHFRRALELTPNSLATLNNLAFVQMKQGKAEALATAERAQKLSPDNTQVLDTLSAAYSSQGRHAEALSTQRKAVALAPQDPFLKLNLVKILSASGDKAAARKELEPLLLNPDARLAKANLPAMMDSLRN